MSQSDRIVAFVFLLLAGLLLLGSWLLPPGMGRLPGPGFFPGSIGGVMLLLSGALLLRPPAAESSSLLSGDIRLAAVVAMLTMLYLALWGTGFFFLRTALFLFLFLRLLGEKAKTGAVVALALTAAVTIAFRYGLHVSLE